MSPTIYYFNRSNQFPTHVPKQPSKIRHVSSPYNNPAQLPHNRPILPKAIIALNIKPPPINPPNQQTNLLPPKPPQLFEIHLSLWLIAPYRLDVGVVGDVHVVWV